MRRLNLELVGWLISGAFLAAALLLLSLDGQDWIVGSLMGLSFAALVPLLFLDFRRDWQEMSGYRSQLGSLAFWTLIVGTVVFILLFAGADIWLSSKIGWPDAYGFHCQGRGCWIENLSHSPKLLAGGNKYELGLFALLWSLPAVSVAFVLYALVKRKRRSRIQPMD